jgi:AcrR family transcriptional regulator
MTPVSASPRMRADERRACLVDHALSIFAARSYRGVTTAEIARTVGVSEPILYRHFEGKRDLYLACLDEAWRRVREIWDAAISAEPDPRLWLGAMGHAYLELGDPRLRIADLWTQAMTEAADDAKISAHLRAHMRDVHEYVKGAIERSQRAGGVLADRNAGAEAWIFVALGLLTTIDRRAGALVDGELPAIFAARREWLTGAA